MVYLSFLSWDYRRFGLSPPPPLLLRLHILTVPSWWRSHVFRDSHIPGGIGQDSSVSVRLSLALAHSLGLSPSRCSSCRPSRPFSEPLFLLSPSWSGVPLLSPGCLLLTLLGCSVRRRSVHRPSVVYLCSAQPPRTRGAAAPEATAAAQRNESSPLSLASTAIVCKEVSSGLW